MTETTTAFTFAQLALMGAFAVLAIVGILYGRRLKRRRLEAEAKVEDHREAVGDRGETSLAAPPEAARPAPAPPPVISAAVPAPIAPETPVAAPDLPPPVEITPPAPVAETPALPEPDLAPVSLAGDITQLKGLGPKLAATLAQLGVTRVDQIAAMSPKELLDLDVQLGPFKGRPARDRWAEQARLLVAGDKAAYEAEFGKLG